MILVAVVDAATDEPDVIRVGELAAVVAPDSAPGPGQAESLLQHAALVADVFERHRAVLPARAGTTADAAEVSAWLEERQADLRTTLDLLRDRCELAVTWSRDAEAVAEEPSPGASPGVAYLAGLRDRWAGADQAEGALEQVRSQRAVVDLRVLSRSPDLLKASVLVGRDCWTDVRDVVAAGLTADGRWRCTGPYPAYSFVRTGAPS